MEEVGSSGKVSLSEKVVLVFLVVKEGSRFLPSRRGVVKVDSKSCCQGGWGVLEAYQRRINLASGLDSVAAGRAITGARGSGSVGALARDLAVASSSAL